MDNTGAYGGGKVGSGFTDPLAYLKKPSVVFRIGALVSIVTLIVSLATSGPVTVKMNILQLQL